jgi:hypothetical protein
MTPTCAFTAIALLLAPALDDNGRADIGIIAGVRALPAGRNTPRRSGPPWP